MWMPESLPETPLDHVIPMSATACAPPLAVASNIVHLRPFVSPTPKAHDGSEIVTNPASAATLRPSDPSQLLVFSARASSFIPGRVCTNNDDIVLPLALSPMSGLIRDCSSLLPWPRPHSSK